MNTWKTPSIIVGLLLVVLIVNSLSRRSGNQGRESVAEGKPKAITNAGTPSFDLAGPIHEIFPTLTEITNDRVRFFAPSGDPLLGYVESGKGHIRIFSKASGVDPLGNKVNPMTQVIIQKLISNFQEATNLANSLFQAQTNESSKLSASNEIAQAEALAQSYQKHYISQSSRFTTAVLIVDELNRQNMQLSFAASELLSGSGLPSTPGFFTPAFIEDGLFAKTFSGQSDALIGLPFTNITRSVVLGQQRVSYSTNSQLENLITANMTIDVSAISSSSLRSIFSTSVNASGAGLTLQGARQMAQERCYSQLTNTAFASLTKTILNVSAP